MTRVGGKFLESDMIQEVPTGTIDGSNTSFSITSAPSSSWFELYQDGLYMEPTTDYSISGTTITMVVAPVLGQKLRAVYLRAN